MLINFYPLIPSSASVFIVAIPWSLGLAYFLAAHRRFDVPLALLSIPMVIYGLTRLGLLALLENEPIGISDVLPSGVLLAAAVAAGLGVVGMVMLARGFRRYNGSQSAGKTLDA